MITNNLTQPELMQIKTIRIYNSFGVLRKQYTYPAGTQKLSFSIADLPNGTYSIQAGNGSATETKPILIQR
jgi:hypothetical protein